MEEYVLGFEIVVDDFFWQLMQITNGTDDLSDNEFCLLLRYFLVLLQIKGQIRSFTKLQHSAEGVWIDLNCIIQTDYVWMAQHLMHVVLSLSMLYVVIPRLQVPLCTKLMNLHRHLPQLFRVISLIHLTEPTLSQQT